MASSVHKRAGLISFVVLASIFIGNDLLFMRAASYMQWLALDYGSRLFALAVIFYLIVTRRALPKDFGLTGLGLRPFIFWTIVLTVTCIAIDRFGLPFFSRIIPSFKFFTFPLPDNDAAKQFDLTVGMVIISMSEETIFRGYCATVLGRYFKNPLILTVVAAVIFGSIHWSMGFAQMVTTAAWGVLPFVSILRTGSILPALIAHWATDFVYFFAH